jgi:hypothetical protein
MIVCTEHFNEIRFHVSELFSVFIIKESQYPCAFGFMNTCIISNIPSEMEDQS